jgi:hypothetical protein
MLHRVALVRTDLSEEPSASFIRVTRIGELGTTLAAKQPTQAAASQKTPFATEFVCLFVCLYDQYTAFDCSNVAFATTLREHRSPQFLWCCVHNQCWPNVAFAVTQKSTSLLIKVFRFRRTCYSLMRTFVTLFFLTESQASLKSINSCCSVLFYSCSSVTHTYP